MYIILGQGKVSHGYKSWVIKIRIKRLFKLFKHYLQYQLHIKSAIQTG